MYVVCFCPTWPHAEITSIHSCPTSSGKLRTGHNSADGYERCWGKGKYRLSCPAGTVPPSTTQNLILLWRGLWTGDLQKSLQPQFPSFPKSISSTSWGDAVRRIDLVYPILLLTLEKTWILKLKYCERHRKKHPVFLRVFFSGWIPMKNTTVEGNVPPMRFYENNNSSENDWKWLRWSRKITVWFVFGNWFVLVMWRKLRL